MSTLLHLSGESSRRVMLVGLLLLLLLVVTASRPSRVLADEPLPEPAPVYLPFAAEFHVTQPVAVGDSHSCVIQPSGRVRCWGGNGFGQLGDGTTITSPHPETVFGLPGALTVVAGPQHTCAATGDSVFCWGAGYGTKPVRIQGAPVTTRLATWWPDESCAIDADGFVYCWRPPGAALRRIDDIEGATAFVDGLPCVLIEGGRLRCWDSPGSFFPDDPVWTWPGLGGVRAAVWSAWFAGYKSTNIRLTVLDDQAHVGEWTGSCTLLCCEPGLPNSPVPEVAGAVTLSGSYRVICALQMEGRVAC